MYSFWEKKFWMTNCDFAIVGSGIVGVNTAINIKQKYPKSSVVIIERGALPTGASTKNAGFACFGTVGEILDDLRYQTEEEVIDTIKMRWQGLQLLKDRVPKNEMDLKAYGGYEVFKSKTEYESHLDHLDTVNALIHEATGINKVIKPVNQEFSSVLYNECLFNSYESQLNPVLMMRYLIDMAKKMGITFYNNFTLSSYTKTKYFDLVFSNSLELKTKQLIMCTNAFFKDIHPEYDVIPARNQVIVTEPMTHLKFKGTFHFDCGYVYFRNIGNRLLIGGARNQDLKKEETSVFGSNQKILDYLKSFSEEFLKIKIDESSTNWSGIIATGKSKKPIIKIMDDGSITAVRLGGMGVAIGSMVAYQVSELI